MTTDLVVVDAGDDVRSSFDLDDRRTEGGTVDRWSRSIDRRPRNEGRIGV